MVSALYRLLSFLSGRFGAWVFVITAWFITAGFFLFFPARTANSVRFYRKLFPEKESIFHIWLAWKQYISFTGVHLDRVLLQVGGNIEYTSQGWDSLSKSLETGRGAVLLMSHFGNWEMAARFFKEKAPDLRLLLYMGIKNKEQLESIQKQGLEKSGITIIGASEDSDSPFDIMEGVRLLKSGGVVSMTGDIIWKEDQKTETTRFLGETISLPVAPHALAMVAEVPIFIFFSIKTGPQTCLITMTGPHPVTARTRAERNTAIKASIDNYATILENTLKQHPAQWFHFEKFI